MLTIEVVYEQASALQRQTAEGLDKYAPESCEVRLLAADGEPAARAELGARDVDVVLLLSPRLAAPIRKALDAKSPRSRLLVRWSAPWPADLESFHAVYRDADQVLMACPTYWARLGHLPRTRLVCEAVDLDGSEASATSAPDRPSVLLLKTTPMQRRRGFNLLIDRFAKKNPETASQLDLAMGHEDHDSAQHSKSRLSQAKLLVWDPDCVEAVAYALDAAACGCIPIAMERRTKDLSSPHAFPGRSAARDYPTLCEIIEETLDSRDAFAGRLESQLRAWSWAERVDDYMAAFRAATESGKEEPMRQAAVGAPDLHDEVTVFVTTVGAPSYPACLEHLRLQDCRFVLKQIRDVAPMSAAFQKMLEDCATPYYVQVDEDMLLYPHAVRSLYEAIARTERDVALFAAPLFDVHLDQPIEALKIFRHGIGRHYPFRDVSSCDTERNRRFEADGYRLISLRRPGRARDPEAILGLHGTHWTPGSIYERYTTLQRKGIKDVASHQWISDLSSDFVERFLDRPDELNFFALMGMVSGTLSAQNGRDTEKDYRTYASLPGFEQLQAFFAEFQSPEPQPSRDTEERHHHAEPKGLSSGAAALPKAEGRA